jgi:hypothetical protein
MGSAVSGCTPSTPGPAGPVASGAARASRFGARRALRASGSRAAAAAAGRISAAGEEVEEPASASRAQRHHQRGQPPCDRYCDRMPPRPRACRAHGLLPYLDTNRGSVAPWCGAASTASDTRRQSASTERAVRAMWPRAALAAIVAGMAGLHRGETSRDYRSVHHGGPWVVTLAQRFPEHLRLEVCWCMVLHASCALRALTRKVASTPGVHGMMVREN